MSVICALNSSSDRLIVERTCHKLPTPWGSISLLIKHNRLTVFSTFLLFDQWGDFTSLGRSRNEKITDIKAGSISQHLFTRLLPTGSFCSSPLMRMTRRRVCLQATLSGKGSILDLFMWITPSLGFSVPYIETCYCCMLYSTPSRLSVVRDEKKKASKRNNREDISSLVFFPSLAHFFHSSPTTVSLKQANFIPPCSTKLLHANKQVRCITQTRKSQLKNIKEYKYHWK